MQRPGKQRALKTLNEMVEKFNRRFPVGTAVVLRKDAGDVETKVRGEAFVLSGHSAVAFFEGVSGAYSIENDRVREAAKA